MMQNETIAVDVEMACPQWSAVMDSSQHSMEAVVRKALVAGGWDAGQPAEVSLLLTDDSQIQSLNRTWRGKDRPTNVLSFAALDDEDAPVIPEAPVLLGDVVLAFETCQAEAKRDGKVMADHALHLVVHGVLHLMGWDHEDDLAEAEAMERLEATILADLGIADPYGANACGETDHA